MPALLPPGIFRLAIAAPPPLPGVGRPRVLPRRLLLEVSSTLLLLQPSQPVQGISRHCEPHPFLFQKLREVPHELVNSGFPEELLRLFPAHTPAEREVNGPLLVMLIVEAHQLSERQVLPGCLVPDVLPAETPVW